MVVEENGNVEFPVFGTGDFPVPVARGMRAGAASFSVFVVALARITVLRWGGPWSV